MSKKSKRPDKIDDSPEAMERQARRRRARERDLEAEQRKIKAERAKVLHSFLDLCGSAGLIIVEGVGEEAVAKFREGFEIELGKRLLLLPAQGSVQGEEREDNFAQVTLEAISAHRDAFGSKGVLGFEDVDFTGQSGSGTPQVTEHVAEILAASREKPRDELAVAAFGTGHVHDMPSSHLYDHNLERGFAGQLEIILGLDPRGEPKTILEPGLQPEFIPQPYRSIESSQTPDFGPGMSTL
jgi:hypothetical protein